MEETKNQDRHDCLRTTIQEYKLFEKVGQGSFGVVRRANAGPGEEDVAIKQLVRIGTDIGMLRRVLREIRVMSSLRHPNLLGLKDVLLQQVSPHKLFCATISASATLFP